LYRIDKRDLIDAKIVVVGCGGTGGFISEGLCRLLEKDRKILLIDYDRVEDHNLERQNFYKEDLGKYKSEALAERLSRNYGRRIAYSVSPFSDELLWDRSSLIEGARSSGNHLIIGCVDDYRGRQAISESFEKHLPYWWIDSGNSKDSGQVLIGDTSKLDYLNQSFRNNTVYHLPAPHVQNPALLIPTEPEPVPEDCAERVIRGNQSPVINQVMASLVLQFVHLLLRGELHWMAGYIDMALGTLRMVNSEPETVSKITGKKKSSLLSK
jgi:hypothetical protein